MNIQVIVRIIVRLDNSVLLIKKKGASFWHFPGGKLEINESLEECIIRELREETTLTIDKPDSMVWFQKYERSDKEYVEFFFIKHLTKQNKKILLKCSYKNDVDSDLDGIKWINIKDLNRYNIKPEKLIQTLPNL